MEYDFRNRLAKESDPAAPGQSMVPINVTYTADGLVLTSTDAAGHTTTYEYDARRRQTKITEAGATSGVVTRSGGTAFTGAIETKFAYDAADQLQNTTDALDHTTRFAYDADGRLKQTTSADPDGSETTLSGIKTRTEYDAAGRKTREYSPAPDGSGEVYTSFFYDDAGRLIRTQQPKMHVAAVGGAEAYDYWLFSAYEYYDNGQLKAERTGVAHIDEDDTAWYLTFDGTILTDEPGKEDDVWSTTSRTYDFLGRISGTETTYEGASAGPARTSTTYKIANSVLVVAETAAGQYDVVAAALAANPTADVTAWQTVTTYDQYGRVASVKLPDPDKTSSGDGDLAAPLTKYDYFADGRLKQTKQTYVGGESDLKNLVTTYTYDEFGRTRTVTVDGVVTTTTYDKLGRVKEVRNSDGSTTTNVYNELGELTRTETKDDGILLSWTDYVYDQVGATYRRTVQDRVKTEFSYDALDRQRESQATYLKTDGTVDYVEPIHTTTYNQAGYVFSANDESLTTSFTYDKLGRTLTTVATQSAAQSQSPTTRTTTNVYDDVHRQSSLIDPNGNSTTTTFDGLGREVATSISSGGSTSQTFDAAGNLTAYTDRRGYQFTYEYDALNRRTKEVWVGGDYEIAYSYDDEGLRAQVTAGGVTYAYQYAADGSVTQQSVAIADLAGPVTLDYVYDKFHRLKSRTDNLGGSQIFGYDAAGRLDNSSLVLGSQAFVVTRHYNEQNLVDQIERHVTGETAFLRSSYLYNGAKRFTDITYDLRSGVSSLSQPLVLHYGYDDKGRLDESTGPEGNRTYEYDDLDQLTKVLSDGSTLNSYNYDAGGNHDAVDGTDYVVGENNELDSAGADSFQYDAQSNRTRRTNVDGSYEQYVYDRRNRLTDVEFHDASAVITQRIKYDYDAFDHRVARYLYDGSDNLIGEEHYVYDGDTLLFVLDGSGNVQTRLFNVGTQAVGQQRAGADFEWILTDQLGSTRALVIAAGSGVGDMTAHYDFDAYGNLLSGSSDPTLSVTLYAGYRYEAATGYYEAWHRWYDPQTGRWISQDPIGFAGGTTNLNEYVGNDPLNKIDPTGLEEQVQFDFAQNSPEATDWDYLQSVGTFANQRVISFPGRDFIIRAIERRQLERQQMVMSIANGNTWQVDRGLIDLSELTRGARPGLVFSPAWQRAFEERDEALTGARLAGTSYDRENKSDARALLERDGWTSFYVWDWKLKDGSPDGFRAEAFKRQNKDHSYTYVLAFAGTDDAHDAAVDYWNAIHKMTNQYEFAMRIGERFALEFGEGNSQVLFVGHSLGGGLATAAAIVTGRRAITYNAAGLSEVVLNAYTKTSGARGSLNDLQPQQIVAHVINGELVSTHQNVIPGLPDTVGEIVTWDPSVSMRDLNFALNGANFGSRLGPGKAKILTAPLGAWIGYSGSRHMVDNFYRGIKLRAPASND